MTMEPLPDVCPKEDLPSELLQAWFPQYQVQRRVLEEPGVHAYVAWQAGLSRYVRLTVLPAVSKEAYAAIQERVRKWAELAHPHLAMVYDFGSLPSGYLYLITEHVDAPTVAVLAHENQWKVKAALPAAIQICQSLQILHEAGLEHGALIPEGIWVMGTEIKLTGISLLPGDTQKPRAPGSRSPDLAALGGVLHWMFAASAPGTGGRLAHHLPPSFASIIHRCLDDGGVNPFHSPMEIAVALQAVQKQATEAKTQHTDSGNVSSIDAARPPKEGFTATDSAPPPGQPLARIQPLVRQRQAPSVLFRLDALVWKLFSTSLQVLLLGATLVAVIVCFAFQNRIVIQLDPSQTKVLSQLVDLAPVTAETTVPSLESEPEWASVDEEAFRAPVPPPALVEPPPAKTALPESPAPDPVISLREQYLKAVQEAAMQALDQVRLDDLPHLQRELQRLQAGEDIPAVDEPDLPASLKALRQRYREVLATHGGD